jgi:hypothetical protein
MSGINRLRAAGAVAIALMSGPALAVTGPVPTGTDGPGGVFLSVWNSSVSVVTYLGQTLDKFGVDAVASGNVQGTPGDGYLEYMTSLAVFGGNLTGVNYAVTAAKFNGLDPRSWETQFTSKADSIGFMDGSQISGANSAITQFLIRVNNDGKTTVPCQATSATAGSFAGAFVEFMNPSLPVNSDAAIGTPMSFFRAFGTSDLEGDPVTVQRYGNLLGATVVNLDAEGKLTFTTPIPLPAAAWLLISGLLGVVTLGRRRQANA